MEDKFKPAIPEVITPILEFPPIKKEDLQQIIDLYHNIYHIDEELARKRRSDFLEKHPFPSFNDPGWTDVYIPAELIPIDQDRSHLKGILSGFSKYTGTDRGIGEGNTFYNSKVTSVQFMLALAVTRHPMIKEITKLDYDKEKFNPKTLIENKIMSGMKILDLGSGSAPVFARCCRAMGADVWTVDFELTDLHEKIFPDRGFFNEEQRKLEIQKHIQLDLEDPNAIEVIRNKSGGNFNLVTEANLRADGFYGGKNIALALLKDGGVYCNPVEVEGSLILKE